MNNHLLNYTNNESYSPHPLNLLSLGGEREEKKEGGKAPFFRTLPPVFIRVYIYLMIVIRKEIIWLSPLP